MPLLERSLAIVERELGRASAKAALTLRSLGEAVGEPDRKKKCGPGKKKVKTKSGATKVVYTISEWCKYVGGSRVCKNCGYEKPPSASAGPQFTYTPDLH